MTTSGTGHSIAHELLAKHRGGAPSRAASAQFPEGNPDRGANRVVGRGAQISRQCVGIAGTHSSVGQAGADAARQGETALVRAIQRTTRQQVATNNDARTLCCRKCECRLPS